MKKLLPIIFLLFISLSLHAQCGPGEDTTAPVFGNAGDGTMANPFRSLSLSTVGGFPSGTYYFNFNGSTFQGVLDNDTDGGGWLMVLNYVHLAGDNTDLTVRNTDLPLLGSSTLGDNEAGTANWGHIGNALAAAIDFEEVRFYGETTGHTRIVNFKTSYVNALNYLKTGVGFFGGINNPANFTTLTGHTANIPALAGNFFGSQGDNALTEFPFFNSGQNHWGIRGLGNRWEVDDTPTATSPVNSQSTIHRVWVRGDLSPAGTPALSVTLDNTGNVSVSPADFGYTFTDNCSAEANINVSLSQTVFACSEIGDNIIQLTATDEQNNSTVIDVTVTVLESPPVINAPPPAPFMFLSLGSDGTLTLDLATLNATVTDDCGIASTVISPATLDCSNTGFNNATITVTDVNGNVSTSNVFFILEDQVPPVIQCVASYTAELDGTGSVTLDPNSLLTSFTDNCQTGNVTLDKTVFTCADIGDNLVTVTASDQAGNETTCTTTVTITIPPCPGNLTLQAEPDACGVTYNYPCASNVTAGPPSGTFLAVGTTTTFAYDTLDNTGGTVSCSYDVTVVDEEGPTFVSKDLTLDIMMNGSVSITAEDFIDSDPLASDYTVDQTGTFNREDISTTGTVVSLFDDEVSSALPIGFEFAFYGNLYNNFHISSNGFITFTAINDNGFYEGQFLPDVNDPNNLIAFDWDDYDPESGGTIRYETIGTAPNRILIMDFDDVAHIDDDTQGTTTQVKLFETSNRIEIHATSISDLGYDKTQGLENIDGTAAIIVPGRNASQWFAANDVVAFIPVTGEVADSCGVNTFIASQTTFDCTNIGENTVTLTATDTNGNITEQTAIVTITDTNNFCSTVLVSPKVFLQGAALNPNMGEETLMRDDLRSNDFIPLTSPYSDSATTISTVFDATGNAAIVDWIWVELRDATDNTIVIKGTSALLQRDGDVVSAVDGISPVTISQVAPDMYYVVLKHRNHLGIMTQSTMALSDINTIVDFTDVSNQITFGTNAQTIFGMPTGIVGMWSGNVNVDTVIQYSGTTPDATGILSIVLNDPSNFLNLPTFVVAGYNMNDINMDGNSQYSGTTPDTPLILQNVLAHPGNFLNFSTFQITEQLPEN
ncbi:HYR domain protein [Kordia sp. SMS9]|uniref:hypothetical protein n=1 Tax=Kordia sp. SMS9 TaxID=2282170 RepID=UPI000E104C26|nr:hypothetical protein [Kordia sp. SMS9]AXG68305.1 HYR domain protein [Kordia sp. SMS9]